MYVLAQANDFMELAKAGSIIVAATAAAIVFFMKAWTALKTSKDSSTDPCVDCRNKVAATYRILNEIKEFLNKEDPMADRPRVYTPKNMEESLKCIKETLRITNERSIRVEDMIDDIHGKSNVWDGNPSL